MSLATSDREQVVMADALDYAQDAEAELFVRRSAASAVEHPSTFRGGLRLPYLSQHPHLVDLDDAVSYQIIDVRLWSGLEHRAAAAQLVAEEIIREQVAALRGKPFRAKHIVHQPEWLRKELRHGEDDASSYGDTTHFRLSARVDDTILHTDYFLPRIHAIEAHQQDNLPLSIKRRLAHQLMERLGEYLGFNL